jgi:hypothetical protein
MSKLNRREALSMAAVSTILAAPRLQEAGAADQPAPNGNTMVIGIPLFQGVTLLDFAGPRWAAPCRRPRCLARRNRRDDSTRQADRNGDKEGPRRVIFRRAPPLLIDRVSGEWIR